MPSSLVFAALALAWLVILVPMVARRRREVVRTADSALAARVLDRRGGTASAAPASAAPASAAPARREEVPMSERPYRPGRGGYDPEAAELAARARYSFRQRVVLGLLLSSLATGLLAGFALPLLWWAHAGVDLILVSYLFYLRRQVRIEQSIRYRRAIRATRPRRALPPAGAPPASTAGSRNAAGPHDSYDSYEEPERDAPPRAPRPPVHPGAAVVELDDEDPAFCELEAESQPSYRRAVGQ